MGLFDKAKAALSEAVSATVGAKGASPLVLPNPWPVAPNVRFGKGLDCVGESFYAANISKASNGRDVLHGVAVLLPEPKNQHDPNAVGIYISGLKVGHLNKAQAAANRQSIIATINQRGCAAVSVAVFHGDKSQVILEPETLGPLSRVKISEVLLAAGFERRATDDEQGFIMRDEGKSWRVFCSGQGNESRVEVVPAYAEALKAAGYKTKVDKSDGYSVVVSGFSKPK